jgi:hypothetical protein
MKFVREQFFLAAALAAYSLPTAARKQAFFNTYRWDRREAAG